MRSELLQGFYLGDWLVEPLTGKVTGRAGSAHLPPTAVEVLLRLASEPGELISRDTLLADVWGEGKGSAEALSRAVREIRHAFDDHADNPKYVQTIPKRGYRLITDPELVAASTSSIVLGAQDGARATDIGLLEKLTRRGVIETAIAYLILGWLLIQVADIVFSQLHLPPWVGTFVTVLVIAGFPIALALSWFLEFRHGKAVVDTASAADSRRRRFSRTYISVIGALALAAVAVFVYDRSIGLPKGEPEMQAPANVVSALLPIDDNTFAVLPFLNLDGSADTQVFANGLVDDVITRMSQVPGLRVASRGDAFTLEPNSASQQVRERLRVAMYLEGSVQMAADEIRVIVQLIDSATGFHVFSRSFDQPRENFFDIRDEITNLTVANVRVALPPDTRAAQAVASERPLLDAYVLYRRGVDSLRLPPTIDTLSSAIGWFDSALNVDPAYAAAHAGKCQTYVERYEVSDDAEFIAKAEAACATALDLNPNLDVVHAALGELYISTGRYIDAETSLLAALDIDSTSVAALTGLGNVYRLQNRMQEAEESLVQATGLHPGDWGAYNALGTFYYRSGRFAEAAEQYGYVVELDTTNTIGFTNLGTAYMLDGNFAAAAPAFQKVLDIKPNKDAFSNLGLMRYYLGEFDAAIAAHRQAVELAPNDQLAWSNLGDVLAIAGEPDEANAAFARAETLARSAMQVNPSDPGTLMDLAWISAMLGNGREARELIDRALTLAPDDPFAHYYDALILLRAADADAALDSLETAAARGYPIKLLAAEPHLASLRGHARFEAIANPE